MLCPNCKQENPDKARFCNSCGAKLDGACPKCGHANPPSSRFCDECGLALNQSSAPPPEQRFSSPGNYTPRHLAERILLSKDALEGERKQVTVLFADLKGSMELLADRDPEQARKLLDPVLEQMMEAVHRYEGTVNQVMGDGIMALFGAPIAHEDHAVRACYAADAGDREAVCAGGAPGGGRVGADPRRAQFRRGRGARDRQRSAHGLHRGGPDHPPGRAHGGNSPPLARFC